MKGMIPKQAVRLLLVCRPGYKVSAGSSAPPSSESESDSPLEGLLKLDDVEEEDPACKGGWLV